MEEFVTPFVNSLFFVACFVGVTVCVSIGTNFVLDVVEYTVGSSFGSDETAIVVVDEILEEVPFGWEILQGLVRYLPVSQMFLLLVFAPPIFYLVYVIIGKVIAYIKSKLFRIV